MSTYRSATLTIAFLLVALTSALAKDPALALTPPMGWNSWNKFGCDVSEKLIRETADAMVSSGMKDAGYQYVVIDDCWQVSRDKDGNIQPDPQRFPSGMKALADYVHSKGLKFGLYSDSGAKTCGGRPGSRGYEFQDARQYAAWGVDYLKYDACFGAVCPAENTGRGLEDQKLEWCNLLEQHVAASQVAYKTMNDALEASGRPILFSMCEWGNGKPWHWAKDIGHMWRTTGDIADQWDGKVKWSSGLLVILDLQDGLAAFAGPGHWNDPDMLEVGNGGMTIAEYRAHFSLWAILAAPLIAGNDLRTMTPEIREILTNKEVIAVDQDSLGRQGRRVRKEGDLEVYAKQLADGGRAVILFNRGPAEKQMTATWEEIGYPNTMSASVRDLWQHKDLGKATGKFSANVPSHGVVMVTLKP